MGELRCRSCGGGDLRTFVDLGTTPLANSYLRPEELAQEQRYPLHARVCAQCLLVQVPQVVPRDVIFHNYAYLSSMSTSWVRHAAEYVDIAIERLGLQPDDLVVEVASNDGYLLRHFVERRHRVLGVEPAANVAARAEAVGVPTLVEFFGRDVAAELRRSEGPPQLIVANNVVAHVPDLNDFLAGIAELCADDGVATFEFPHLLNLVQGVQFDTIYHEHFSYFSLLSFERALARHGLVAWRVEQLPTHGGSLRVWASTDGARPVDETVTGVREAERSAGLDALTGYDGFAASVRSCVDGFLEFLHHVAPSSIAAYGAAAKGNTFLNTCGVTSDDIPVVVDKSPEKQGRLLPGSHIPVKPPSAVLDAKPGYLLILPWNIRTEIVDQMAAVRTWGGRFVIAVPALDVT